MAVIKGLLHVESSGMFFIDAGGIPIVKTEPHVFHRKTGGKYSAFTDLSQPTFGEAKKVWCRGRTMKKRLLCEWDKFERMSQLDPEAAIESSSWGFWQGMGFHWKSLKLGSAREFADKMFTSAGQVELFISFIKADKKLHDALIAEDFDTIALRYNGSRALEMGYDDKIEDATLRAKKELQAEASQIKKRTGQYTRRNNKPLTHDGMGGSVTAALQQVGGVVAVGATVDQATGGNALGTVSSVVVQLNQNAEKLEGLANQVDTLTTKVGTLVEPAFWQNPLFPVLCVMAGIFAATYGRRWWDMYNGK